MANLEFHHLTEDRLDDFIEIVARSRADHPYERRLTREEAKALTLLDLDFDPKGTWFAVLDGKAIGFCSVLVEKSRIDAGLDDGWVDVDVVPEHRRNGVEQQLLEKSFAYLWSRNVGNARARSMVLDEWKRSLLSSYSFEEAYRVYVLVRRGRDNVQPVAVPEGFKIARIAFSECSDADMLRIVDAFNDSFQDHFSFAPERPERFISFRDSVKDPFVLILAMEGDTIAGVCLSEESSIFNREKGVKAGWIDVLGVRPAYRRRGLARAMLADGIGWVLGQGMDTVYLGVFARNEKALTLYKSFGFTNEQESVWYSKDLEKDTGADRKA